MAQEWNVTGDMLEACNCEAECPCFFLSPPTEGDCKTIIGWHIDNGKFGDIALDGLNVLFAAYVPGLVSDGNWKAALYLDERANEEQKNALTQIFSGQSGGHPAILGSFIGEVLGVKSVPIEYQAEGKRRSIRIPDIAEADIEAITDANGNLVTLSNPPLQLSPEPTQVISRSKRLSYRDYNLQWDLEGKSGNYLAFAYEGP